MAQISRPFQIGLVAVVALAGVWLFALHGHSSSSSSESSAPPARPPASAAAQAKAAAAPTPVYHGSAPGVHGLSADVAKAHGAVATSQQNAKQLEQKSAQASSATPAQAKSTSAATQAAPAGSVHKKTVIVHKHISTASGKTTSATLVHQRQVEGQLKAGDVAVVLFWDRNGSDDVAVHRAVMSLRGKQHKVAVTVATPGEVASFGAITRGVQVYGTPTVLVIGKARQATVITGFTSTFAIQQAIAEARHA